ncbi:MAG: hypothetical protein Q8942_19000 [Bacillota bacterium]|nr:hypothetical protein [Bacillota bacterium]
MFPPGDINNIIKDILARLNNSVPSNTSPNSGNNASTGNKVGITPSQALIIVGLLGGALSVDSVLVDKDQTVQIVLTGSLKQKTELEKMLDQIGNMPFDEVVKTMLGRLY